VLQHVQAPLASWVDVAAEYFRQRKFAQFEAVFRETFAAGEYGMARVLHRTSRGGAAINPSTRPLYTLEIVLVCRCVCGSALPGSGITRCARAHAGGSRLV